MKIENIKQHVNRSYWKEDLNCATTLMKNLAHEFSIELNDQVIQSLTGMHGAGKYGAQCGLVEGTLMFIGLFGHSKKNEAKRHCKSVL